MSSILNRRLRQRSFLMRVLQTTGISLALMTASAAGVHAEDAIVQGANGASGFDNCDQFGDNCTEFEIAGYGDVGGSATANAGSLLPITSPLNNATAIGGMGGNGGNNFNGVDGIPGAGGSGGAAKARAATTLLFGTAGANAVSTGGLGGDSGSTLVSNSGAHDFSTNGGTGGAATASATGSTGSGNATVSASATAGSGGFGGATGGFGGDANASSMASTKGSGNASSYANATGGVGGSSQDNRGGGGNATAMADALAAGGGTATAKAIATPGPSQGIMGGGFATATSTAKASSAGVSVQTSATAATGGNFIGSPPSTVTTEAIAQGGSGQTAVDPSATAAVIATVLPDEAYAAMLIGGASNVADALLGPDDEIFGTAILEGSNASATFDFSFRGDLILGEVDDNRVINLGFFWGPVDLTLEEPGIFVLGGAVPEPSIWAMMLVGFAGLGFAGYRQSMRASFQPV
jgi:hypothetical protein